MKAVVMEKKNNECAILCDDGTFRKIKGNYEVGEKIDYKPKASFVNIKYLAGLAAAMLIFFGAGTYELAFSCSYVTVDVNPSIEYELNRINRVIGVTALNDDATAIVDTLYDSGIRFSALNEAIDMTVDELKSRGYLLEDDNTMLVDVVADDEERSTDLEVSVAESSAYNSEDTTVICLKSTKEVREEAKKNGISAGRYEVMIESGAESDGSANENENVMSSGEKVELYKKRPVKELVGELENVKAREEGNESEIIEPDPTKDENNTEGKGTEGDTTEEKMNLGSETDKSGPSLENGDQLPTDSGKPVENGTDKGQKGQSQSGQSQEAQGQGGQNQSGQGQGSQNPGGQSQESQEQSGQSQGQPQSSQSQDSQNQGQSQGSQNQGQPQSGQSQDSQNQGQSQDSQNQGQPQSSQGQEGQPQSSQGQEGQPQSSQGQESQPQNSQHQEGTPQTSDTGQGEARPFEENHDSQQDEAPSDHGQGEMDNGGAFNGGERP